MAGPVLLLALHAAIGDVGPAGGAVKGGGGPAHATSVIVRAVRLRGRGGTSGGGRGADAEGDVADELEVGAVLAPDLGNDILMPEPLDGSVIHVGDLIIQLDPERLGGTIGSNQLQK